MKTITEIEKGGKLQVDMVANVVNNLFLDNDYQGKDWEAVRKALIKDLSNLLRTTLEDRDREDCLDMLTKCIDITREVDKEAKGGKLSPKEKLGVGVGTSAVRMKVDDLLQALNNKEI